MITLKVLLQNAFINHLKISVFSKISKIPDLIVIGIFLYAILIRLAIPTTPFADPDSIGYLGVAFNYLNTDTFTGIAERSYPYPGILTFLLSMSNDVSIISVVQHILGILGGVYYLKAMSLIKSKLLNLSSIELFLYDSIKTIGLLLLLVSPWQIMIEHYTRPESLTMPLLTLYLYSALKAFLSIDNSSLLSKLKYSTIFLFFSWIAQIFQPRFTLAFLSAGAIFIAYVLIKKISLAGKFFIITPTLIIIFLFTSIPQIKHFSYLDAVNCNKSAGFFFYNLNTLVPILEKDFMDPKFKKYDKNILKTVINDYGDAKNPKNKNFSTGYLLNIGYNSDYTLKTYYFLLTTFNGEFIMANQFYRYYLKQAIHQDPIGLLKKVYLEFTAYYKAPIFPTRPNYLNFASKWDDSFLTASSWKPHFTKNSNSLDGYISDLNNIRSIKLNYKIQTSTLVKRTYLVLNKVFIPMCVTFTLALIFAISRKSKHARFGIMTFFTLLFETLIVLTISIGASTEIERYVSDMQSLNLILVLFMTSFLILFFMEFKLFELKKYAKH